MVLDVFFVQGLWNIPRETLKKTSFYSLFSFHIHELFRTRLWQMPVVGLHYFCSTKHNNFMKALIVILAAIILTSCSVEFQCPSYGNSNRATKNGYKAQSHYAKHNKVHKAVF